MGQDSSAQISSYWPSPTTARFMVQLMYMMYVTLGITVTKVLLDCIVTGHRKSWCCIYSHLLTSMMVRLSAASPSGLIATSLLILSNWLNNLVQGSSLLASRRTGHLALINGGPGWMIMLYLSSKWNLGISSHCVMRPDRWQKNFTKRAAKGSTVIQPQPTKALGQHVLLKEGCVPTPVWDIRTTARVNCFLYFKDSPDLLVISAILFWVAGKCLYINWTHLHTVHCYCLFITIP